MQVLINHVKLKPIPKHCRFLAVFIVLLINSLFVVAAGIESLFGKVNCDKNAIDDMLGTNQGVTDTNLLQYLGVIEERTNELLLTQAYVNSQKVRQNILL